jgi:hypothetical protein
MTLPRFTRGQWVAGTAMVLAMLAMFANESRLEHQRPAVPAGSYTQPVHFKDTSGHVVTMFISGRDQWGRLGITAVFLGALGASDWLQKRRR